MTHLFPGFSLTFSLSLSLFLGMLSTPLGVHMAHLLKKKGYTNVTVLERGSEPGGRSLTLFVDSTGPLVPHEMGTVFMHPGYHR